MNDFNNFNEQAFDAALEKLKEAVSDLYSAGCYADDIRAEFEQIVRLYDGE